ncbi:MAG: CHASE2 domain-containing protein, partial [Thermoanaerobaculia bacterium]
AGARAVLYDVVFADDSRMGVSDDREFASAIREAGQVHLAAKLEPGAASPTGGALERSAVRIDGWRFPGREGLGQVVGPNRELEPAAAGIGLINVVQDRDSTIRRADLLLPHQGRLLPALGLAGALAALGGAREGAVEGRWLRLAGRRAPLEPDGRLLLRWYAPESAFPTYQASDLVQSWGNLADEDEATRPLVDPARFRDRVVFVGVSISGNEDVITAPTSTRLRGVELHATLCANLLGSEFLRRPVAAARAAALVLGGLLAGLVTFAAWRPLRAGLWGLALMTAQALVALAAFPSGLALDLLVPELVLAAAFLVSAIAVYLGEGRQKREVARAFGQYLSPAVIRDLMRRPEGLRLGGEAREITVFFSDLEGFSGFSERMQPEELVAFLNLYLGAMTDVIQARRGVVDKYQGDSVMAFWGAPEPLADDAAQACLAAVEQRQALATLNRRFAAEGRPLLRMRAGLHRGPAVVGNMGSAQRFAYTAMGDTVNLASRLEGANKFFGSSILLSEAARLAAGEAVVARRLGRIRVVGKSLPTAVYELWGRPGE